jgi:transcriptional regulator with XRE-family HTH domain
MILNTKKIKNLRMERNMTQEELAEKIFTSQAMVTYMELGVKKPGVELLRRMAKFFGCSMEELMVDETA